MALSYLFWNFGPVLSFLEFWSVRSFLEFWSVRSIFSLEKMHVSLDLLVSSFLHICMGAVHNDYPKNPYYRDKLVDFLSLGDRYKFLAFEHAIKKGMQKYPVFRNNLYALFISSRGGYFLSTYQWDALQHDNLNVLKLLQCTRILCFLFDITPPNTDFCKTKGDVIGECALIWIYAKEMNHL